MDSDIDRWDRTNNILAEIMEEREKQFEKWGDQRLPFTDPQDPTGVYLMGRTYAALERAAKARCDAYRDTYLKGDDDPRNDATVLLEEVFEALAAGSPEDLRTEMIQVAAVAVKIIACLDRAAGPPMVDDVTRPVDVFLPGDGSVITTEVDGTIRVRPEDDALHVGRWAVESPPETIEPRWKDHPELGPQVTGSLIPPEPVTFDDTPTRDLRAIDAQTGHPFVPRGLFVPSVTPEEIDSNYSKDLVEDAPSHVHRHTFDRLHGLCRCGEAGTP
jgi:hypothetical protein